MAGSNGIRAHLPLVTTGCCFGIETNRGLDERYFSFITVKCPFDFSGFHPAARERERYSYDIAQSSTTKRPRRQRPFYIGRPGQICLKTVRTSDESFILAVVTELLEQASII